MFCVWILCLCAFVCVCALQEEEMKKRQMEQVEIDDEAICAELKVRVRDLTTLMDTKNLELGIAENQEADTMKSCQNISVI